MHKQSVYDLPCPECAGKIVSTARMLDDSKAPTSCENNHIFMRAKAYQAAKPIKAKTIRIEAASRLKAVQEIHLMARATPITKVAGNAIKEITRQLLIRGYKTHTDQMRAYYVTKFCKDEGTEEERNLELVGWHGNGKYGLEKTVFEFYDQELGGQKPVINLGAVTEENLTVAKQEKVINEILEYIKKHC